MQNASISSSSVSMGTAYRLDSSYTQGRMLPRFKKSSDQSNLNAMGQDKIDIGTVRVALREIMDRKGVKPTTLSLMVGKNKTLVKDLFEKTNDISVSTLSKLAGALDVSVLDLLAAPGIPLVGYIGAGGVVIYEEVNSGETVIRPPNVSMDLIALEVRGDSMLPKYSDGDIIYIGRQHDGVLPQYLGRDCAVRLVSGETYIKQLMKGSEEGKFTLLSLNAPPIENVEVEWASPVAFIMPSHSRYQFS